VPFHLCYISIQCTLKVTMYFFDLDLPFTSNFKLIIFYERGSNRSHYVEKSFWGRLRNFHKTDSRMNGLWHAQTVSFQNMKSCENVRNYYEDIYISTTTSMELYYHGIMIFANNEDIFKISSLLFINNFFLYRIGVRVV
jgi:hypothetical protein